MHQSLTYRFSIPSTKLAGKKKQHCEIYCLMLSHSFNAVPNYYRLTKICVTLKSSQNKIQPNLTIASCLIGIICVKIKQPQFTGFKKYTQVYFFLLKMVTQRLEECVKRETLFALFLPLLIADLKTLIIIFMCLQLKHFSYSVCQ